MPNTFASTPSRIPYCCSKATGKHILLSICCYHYLDASHTTLLQSPQSVKDAVSVANNACWAIGELAIKVCAYFYTFLLNPAAPNSFSKHKIPFFFVLLLLSSNRLAWVSSWYMSLISVHWPTTEVISFVLISLVFVKFRTHVTDFLFPDWQRNRTCGDQCCFLLGSHSKVPRGK